MPIIFFTRGGEGDYCTSWDVSDVGILFFGVFGAVVFYVFFDFFQMIRAVETAVFAKPF